MAFAQWASLDFGQETYEVNSLPDLFKAEQAARSFGIQTYVVHDAGRTQIAPMTPTVCAFGPATEEQAKAILNPLGINKLE
jgi:PTH2 family peptidyl-tRNA hydrolase